MYYKITNKESDVYKQLHELRTKELQIQDDNEKSIEEKTGLKFKTFLGDSGQQNFRRVRQYQGFKFTTPEKVDLKIWKADNEHKEIFVPNRRSKLGREMAEFLLNGLKGSRYDKVFEILKLEHGHKFNFPYVELFDDTILLYLGNDLEPSNENIIEITKKEFYEISCRS